MKLIATLLLLLFITFYSQSQDFQWAKSSGGHVDDSAIGLTTDSEGNAYLCGALNSGTSIGEFTFNNWGAYLAKFNLTGDVLWAINFGSFDTYGVDIALDSEANVYLAGIYSHGFSFQGVTLTGGLQSRIFVMKVSPEGSLIWLKGYGTISNTGRSFVNAIDIDDNDNVYLGGNFQNPIQLGDSIYTVRGRESFDSDMLLLKLSPSGEVLSVKNPGSTSSEYIYDIKVGNSGIYVTGFSHGSSIEFEEFIYSSTRNQLGFVYKYSFDGDLEWVNTIDASEFSESTALVVNSKEEIIVAGQSIGESQNNVPYTFISKLSKDGNLLNKRIINYYNSSNSGLGVFARKRVGLAINGDDLYFTTGLYGSLNIDHLNFNSFGNTDAVIIKFNEVGYPQWLSAAQGPGNDRGVRVATTTGSNILMAGNYSSSQLNFGSSISINNNSGNNDEDFFLSNSIDTTSNLCPAIESFYIDYVSDFCQGDSILLSINNPYAIYTKWMLNGASLEQDNEKEIYITEEGLYELYINSDTRCPVSPIKVKVDKEVNRDAETDIIIYPSPIVEINSPEGVCFGDTLRLSASFDETFSYAWLIPQGMHVDDTTSNELSLPIQSFTKELKFLLYTKNKITGCTSIDSVVVKVYQKPILNLNLSAKKLTVLSDSMIFFSWFLEGVEIEEFKDLKQVEVYESGNYYVQGISTFGCISVTDSIYINESILSNKTVLDELKVFPNPSYGKINVATTAKIKKIEVVNMAGELMLVIHNTKELNIEHLDQGIYLIHFYTDMGLKTIKIVRE